MGEAVNREPKCVRVKPHTIVDEGYNLLAFVRMDDTRLPSIKSSQREE